MCALLPQFEELPHLFLEAATGQQSSD